MQRNIMRGNIMFRCIMFQLFGGRGVGGQLPPVLVPVRPAGSELPGIGSWGVSARSPEEELHRPPCRLRLRRRMPRAALGSFGAGGCAGVSGKGGPLVGCQGRGDRYRGAFGGRQRHCARRVQIQEQPPWRRRANRFRREEPSREMGRPRSPGVFRALQHKRIQ